MQSNYNSVRFNVSHDVNANTPFANDDQFSSAHLEPIVFYLKETYHKFQLTS